MVGKKFFDGVAPSPPFDGFNLGVIQAEVQPSYQFPNGTRTVVLVDQLLDVHCAQQNLAAINRR